MASRKNGIGAEMERAALELYAERGSLRMTGAEVAARAGTTERTFFRHFPDKLDVFFGDESRLRTRVYDAIVAAPPGLPPLAAVMTGMAALAADFATHSDVIRARAAIIAAHPELQAREMARNGPWMARIAQALVRRGSPASQIDLSVALGLIVWRTAYERWLAAPDQGALDRGLIAVLAEVGPIAEDAERALTA
jgi:AcrR family transcriptional regulator